MMTEPTSDTVFGNSQREAGARVASEQLRRELAISHVGFGFVAAAQAHAEMAELTKLLVADCKWVMGYARLDVYRQIEACKQLARRMAEERALERKPSRIILAR